MRFVLSLSLFFLATVCLAETRVVILGTGTPVPDPKRSGPGVAVLVGGEAYLFDAGGGMVKRAVEAMDRHALPALNPQDIDHLFLTHLHSDHIHDVSELASARWWGRQERLQIFGPRGLEDYVESMNRMNRVEAETRAAGTPPALITMADGYLPQVHEIEEGLVFENEDIRVEAFAVPHGEIRPAFGYRVITDDKRIVISGDTAFSEELAEQARGADLLIHEVISGDRLSTQSEFWQQYHGASHTTATEVARVAEIARPDLLVLTHILFLGGDEEEILAEVRRNYDGEVVLAEDLDIF